jgi:FixJ family two-component response regulator
MPLAIFAPQLSLMSLPAPATSHLIAIVEDDKAVLDALRFTLQTQGYAVCGFASGRDAARSGRILDADCLVIDYAMPNMDGIGVLQALRQRGLDCPAIIIAGNPTPRCYKEAEVLGATVLEKPLMDDVLGHGVRAALAGP